jgi:hypothetical protein
MQCQPSWKIKYELLGIFITVISSIQVFIPYFPSQDESEPDRGNNATTRVCQISKVFQFLILFRCS